MLALSLPDHRSWSGRSRTDLLLRQLCASGGCSGGGRQGGLGSPVIVLVKIWSGEMASTKQRNAARKNIKKAASAAKRKRTIAHLPKSVRTALGKQASSVAKKSRKSHSRD